MHTKELAESSKHIKYAIEELTNAVVLLDGGAFENTIKGMKETIGDLHASVHSIETYCE